MSIKIWNFFVKREKLGQFKEVFNQHSGFYLRNPIISELGGEFSFQFDDINDYNAFNREWDRLNTQIKEIRSDQPWKKVLRRVGVRV